MAMKLRQVVRYCCSKLWSKQFLTFLFSLFLSAMFWLFQSLSETADREFDVPLRLRGVPQNVVITTDPPAALRVTLRDKAGMLLAYALQGGFQPVEVDFASVANGSGHVTLQPAELLRQLTRQLEVGTQIVASKPESVEFYYNYGLCKRVPVEVDADVRVGGMFSLSATRVRHDSVTVYASRALLDNITAARTSHIALDGVTDTTRVKAAIQAVKGAKFVPAVTYVTFCVDRLVEKTVQVPVQQVNFPASKQLRTFPASVSVSFQVPMGQYRDVTKESFVLVVNYEDLLRSKSSKCHLSLKSVPRGVSHVRIVPQDVEYIIEELPEAEGGE